MRSGLAATFAHSLRKAREERGLTQAEVSELAGLAVEAYGRLERGQVLPRAATLVSLSLVLQMTTDSLLGLTANAGGPPQRFPSRSGERSERGARLLRRLEGVGPRAVHYLDQLLAELLKK